MAVMAMYTVWLYNIYILWEENAGSDYDSYQACEQYL